MRSEERVQEGHQARMLAEIEHSINGTPVVFSCIYKRPEQINQYRRGWDNVSQVDINTAVNCIVGNKPIHHITKQE